MIIVHNRQRIFLGHAVKRKVIAHIFLPLAVCFSVSSVPEVAAQIPASIEAHRVEAVSHTVFSRLAEIDAILTPVDEAGKAIADAIPDYAAALRILDELRTMSDLNSADLTQIWNTYGNIHVLQKNYAQAVKSYEQILNLPAADPRVVHTILFSLAKLHMAQEQYQKVVDVMTRWFKHAETPSPDAYILYGQAYAKLGQFSQARIEAERGVQLARDKKMPLQEDWYRLLRHIYSELGDKLNVLAVTEQLAQAWPQRTYFMQLAYMYGQNGQEEKQLAMTEVAYRSGWLTSSRDLENLARLYLYNGAPIKAATLMQDGLDTGVIDRNRQTLELLATGYINAQDYRNAIVPLTQAATISSAGELYLRLAQVYRQLGDHAGTSKNARLAISVGGLRRPDEAYVLKGMADYDLDQLTDAKIAFRQAAKSQNSMRLANEWIHFIENEEKRRQDLQALVAD